jgi:predicted HicB family RNase H-like nuclease
MAETRVKSAQITVRVEPHFKAAAERAAKLDRRSVNSLVEKLLHDYMQSVGIDPDKPLPPDSQG